MTTLRSMLRDMPRGAWWGVTLGWARTLSLSLAFVAIGRGVDALVDGGAAGPALAAAAASGAVAVACAGVAAAEPPRLQAAEESSLRGRAIRAALALELAERDQSGATVSRLTDGVERVAAYRASFLGPTLASFTSPLIVLVVIAVAVDPVVAAVLFVMTAFVPVVIAGFMRLFRRPNARFRRLAAAAAARFLEMLRALGTLRLLGAEGQGRGVVAAAAEELRREIAGMQRRNQLMILANDVLFSIVMITVAITSAMARYGAGAVSIGAAAAMVLLATLLHEPIDKVGRSFYVGMGGRAQQTDLRRTFGALPVCSVAPDAALHAAPSIVLRDVRVSRAGREVLGGVDVAVPPGGVLAVVGPTGAGKSTLAAALQGLVPVDDGQILLDGQPAGRDSLRTRIRTVSQRPFLFTGTIAENLRFAREDATDDELWSALRTARLDDEVRAMPATLDTAVGEAGAALSGGQVRRLAIARAVLSGAGALVLDEPTADLDRRTESLVTESVRALAGERTLVIVAHRLETIAFADQVLVLEGGSQTAVGTPADVKRAGGYYAAASAGEEPSW